MAKYTITYTAAGDRRGPHAMTAGQRVDLTLYRATDSRYAGDNKCGWRWWSPDRAWAASYGSNIVECTADGLRLLDLPLDGPDVRDALVSAGIDCDDIDFVDQIDDDITLPLEVHQVLTSRHDGPLLAARLQRAGYDGVTHPDHVEGQGIGTAVALICAE